MPDFKKAAFSVVASTFLALTGCGSEKPKNSSKAQASAVQQQIDAMELNNGLSYIGDPRTGMCFAAYPFQTYSHIGVSITRVRCTPEVLNLISVPQDRPGYTPSSLPRPSTQP